MPELTPDLSDPTRCISVHWALPVQCVLATTHRDDHETWHPETGNRLRYTAEGGAFRTEELHHGAWHRLQIPPPGCFGPDRIRVQPTTSGAEIDTEVHDRQTVETVLGLLLGEFADDFEAIADLKPTHDGRTPERLPYERLVAALVAALPKTAPLYGAEVARMADELHTIARPKGLPSQREAGAA